MDCFSRLANCLDSLHGVKPEMSATAGSGEEMRIDERASAAEKALRFWFAWSVFSGVFGVWFVFVLQWIMLEESFGFWVNLGLRVEVGLERLVGMVRDIFVCVEEEWLV